MSIHQIEANHAQPSHSAECRRPALKPRYCLEALHANSRNVQRLLRGGQYQDACDQDCLDATVSAVMHRVGVRHPETYPYALVRWTVERRVNERGCHVLRHPVIVGVILPRADGEPQRWMRWGARAKAILIAAVTP